MAKTTSLSSSRDWKVRNGYLLSFWEVAWLFPTAHFCTSLFSNSLRRLTSSVDSRLTSPSLGPHFARPLTLSLQPLPSPSSAWVSRFRDAITSHTYSSSLPHFRTSWSENTIGLFGIRYWLLLHPPVTTVKKFSHGIWCYLANASPFGRAINGKRK